ncbi:MAG: methyltransferase [Bradyrhizobiaceae bacterium]|nr:methyltransferase [Bradyrhizobiaceae bacterium]
MHSRPAEVQTFPFATTDDAVLGGRLKLMQPARGHRAGHDAILLAAAAARATNAVDLGAGIGTAGLSLLVRSAARYVTLVDSDPELVRLAAANAERNGYGERVSAVQTEVEKLARRGGPAKPAAASADLVILNPPFNDPAQHRPSPDPRRRRAHAAPETDLEQWIAAADRLLRGTGRIVLIHRPEKIAKILEAMENRFGAIELIPIHANGRGPAIRVIVRGQKGKRTPLAFHPPFVLNGEDGQPTHAAEAVLRGAAALDAA